MLKIQPTHQALNELTVALIGTVKGEYLPELEALVRRAAEDGRRLSFDLSQVRLVDRDAVWFLAAAVEGGVRLLDCPAYLRQWLRSESRARTVVTTLLAIAMSATLAAGQTATPAPRQAGSLSYGEGLAPRQAGSLSYGEGLAPREAGRLSYGEALTRMQGTHGVLRAVDSERTQ